MWYLFSLGILSTCSNVASTSPNFLALLGFTDAPANIIFSASCKPITRGSRTVYASCKNSITHTPPAPGNTPNLISGNPNCVFLSVLLTRYVHANANSKPPPKALPFYTKYKNNDKHTMAAMVGTGKLAIKLNKSWPALDACKATTC